MNQETMVFMSLRGRLLQNLWRSLRRRHPLLKILGVLLLVAALWGALFGLFYAAFQALGAEYSDFRLLMLSLLFSVFFLIMLALLTLSNAVFGFASLTRSWETDFLHATPVSPASIFWHRLMEAEMYSMWAVILLCLPLVAAFGLAVGAPWHFYLFSLALFVLFVSIAVSAGSILALLFVNHFLTSRRRLLLLISLLVGAFVFFAGGEIVRQRWLESSTDITHWLEGPMAKLNMAQNAFLPSMWLSDAMMLSAQGHIQESLFSLCLLGGNAMFFGMAAYLLAEGSYQRAYHTAQDYVAHHRASARRLVYRVTDGLLSLFVGSVQRQIIVKDLKVFLRSPVQWSQVLLFFGILAIYFINVQHFQKAGTSVFSASIGSFVNLVSIALTLCTFTVRFAYPVISLEGINFWVLGMAPVKRRDILGAKFIAVLAGSLVCAIPLVLLSDLSLGLGRDDAIMDLIAMCAICFGLTALSVGLGALHLAFHEVNPAKIVAGLGGTVNLILSLAFVAVVLLFLALPNHVTSPGGTVGLLWEYRAYTGGGVILLTVALCVAMHFLGGRALNRLEI